MRNNRIHTIWVLVGVLSLLWSCQKQVDGPMLEPARETVDVRFNTFLKEGDNVRPFNVSTRSTAGVGTRAMAGEGTLAHGFYLYGHAHTKSFATSSGNTYTPIFEKVKVNADGTYAIPKFWLQDKTLLYSFQAFAAMSEKGEVEPGTVTIPSSGVPYVSSQPAVDYIWQTDVLGAAVYDIKMGDDVPTVNLYFEHRLAKLSLQMQRLNAGGPTLYNLQMDVVDGTFYLYWKASQLDWAPGKIITPAYPAYMGLSPSGSFTLPASAMKPIEAQSFILAPQTIKAGAQVILSYTLKPEAVSSASNPRMSLTTTLPAFTLESGKQLNVVIGHVVESDQIVVQSVTLTPWVTAENNVPEYK